MTAVASLAEKVLAGDTGAIGRVLTRIERRAPGVDELVSELQCSAGRAHVIGVTGPPGSGKSTLVGGLTARMREQGRTVGIIAVDPSSAITGGAILGDRIRMSGVAGDPGVFIRSIATRGALGGLSRATLDSIITLDAAGKDVVIVETVGVGQAEVDVMSAAQTVVVVSMPGTGDDVQAIKAGLLEIADVHVVNKFDHPGARKTFAELRTMLRSAPQRPGAWPVPVEKAVGTTGEGVTELVERFAEHREWLVADGGIERWQRRSISTRIRWIAEELVLERLRPGHPEFDRAVEDVLAHRGDSGSLARRLLTQLGNLDGRNPRD
ncbi:methylmalonyl Co-A mutase-associated GTPase MeaB [Pseudonocardia sp.]|uniref:methylmalonyl Co-A mutase-associated GTPase MeaB n=1 Tax=Pseudonocardia sp. TaxID=60912 RepID=UPI003D09CD1D